MDKLMTEQNNKSYSELKQAILNVGGKMYEINTKNVVEEFAKFKAVNYDRIKHVCYSDINRDYLFYSIVERAKAKLTLFHKNDKNINIVVIHNGESTKFLYILSVEDYKNNTPIHWFD